MAGEPFSLSVKLPYTGEVALDLPYAKPTAYGLGKSGWVSFTPSEGEMPSLDQLKDWIDESYRAQAPKKLVKELDSRADRPSLRERPERAGAGAESSTRPRSHGLLASRRGEGSAHRLRHDLVRAQPRLRGRRSAT